MITMQGAIYALKYTYQEKPSYSWHNHYNETSRTQLEASEWVYICDCPLEVEELSEGEFKARQVAGLRLKKQALTQEFVKQSQMVEDQIQNLLCLTNEPTLTVRVPNDDFPF